ncbi:J domain-containing protein [Bacillus sp. EB600]|nr:J domain-containing protein [Bacillus sp. EB600]
METIENYYHILGVSNYATFNEIKEAYRKKVKELHPDKVNGNAELFKKIKEAYEVLQNDEKRKRYDDLLFKTENYMEHHPKHVDPSKTTPSLLIIRPRKSQKLISLSINVAFILIGILGTTYFNKDKE